MSSQYHEPPEELSAKTRDCTRILMSLKEEIEAVDWYNQRMDLATDHQVRAILEHNRNEEMEHACMALEWLRRNMPHWDEMLRTYLFTEGEILSIEEGSNGGAPSGSGSARGLGIGRLGTRGGK